MCLYNVATYGLAAGGHRYCTIVSYFYDKVFFRFAPSVTYQQLASLHSGPRACYLTSLDHPLRRFVDKNFTCPEFFQLTPLKPPFTLPTLASFFLVSSYFKALEAENLALTCVVTVTDATDDGITIVSSTAARSAAVPLYAFSTLRHIFYG